MMMTIAALDIEALASFAKKSHHNIIQNPNLVDIYISSSVMQTHIMLEITGMHT